MKETDPTMENLTFVAGTGAESPQDLKDRLALVEEKIRRDAREIVDVLRVDFPGFLERQARERYIAAGDAFSLDAEARKKVKADLQEAGRRAVEEILPGLDAWEHWVSEDVEIPPPGERRDLRGNPHVHGSLQRIGGYLKEVLAAHGFPGAAEESFDDVYRLPTWFISGRLLISLVESYWRNLEEYRALSQALDSIHERDRRSRRGDEWDAA